MHLLFTFPCQAYEGQHTKYQVDFPNNFMMLRKARTIVWLFFSFLAAYSVFLLLSTDSHPVPMSGSKAEMRGRQELQEPISNVQKRNMQCPVDAEFLSTIKNTSYGQPITRKVMQIVYISVPKCASRTMVWLAWRQRDSDTSSITDIISLPYLVRSRQDVPKLNSILSDSLQTMPQVSFFHGHFRYLETDHLKKPIFISMLRDPLARHVSWFHFLRFGDQDMKADALKGSLGKGTANDTYDECVLKKKPHCNSYMVLNLNVVMFCGYEEKCENDPEQALEQAKRNLDKFLFVGIVEEYDDSIRVMERLIPGAFSGMLQRYTDSKAEFSAMSKTSFKKNPEPKTAEMMKELLKYDYEFYNYAKERFHKLKKHLGITSCNSER